MTLRTRQQGRWPNGLIAMVFTLSIMVGGYSQGAGASSTAGAELGALLQQVAQDYIDRFDGRHGAPQDSSYPFQYGGELPVGLKVKVRVDLQAALIHVDYGPGMLGKEDDGTNEQLEQEVGSAILDSAWEAGMPRTTELRTLYEGRPYGHHFPSVRQVWGPSRDAQGSPAMPRHAPEDKPAVRRAPEARSIEPDKAATASRLP